MGTGQPTLDDAITAAMQGAPRVVRVAVDAVVESWDPATNIATVTPAVDLVRNGDGMRITLPDLPVRFPAAGGRAITWGLAPGDLVTLLVRDVSHDELDSGSPVPLTPQSRRRWDLSDAVVLPIGGGPRDPLPVHASGAPTVTMGANEVFRVGDVSAATFVALGQLVDDAFSELRTRFNLHVHTSAAPGSPTSVPTTPLPAFNPTVSARLATDDTP